MKIKRKELRSLISELLEAQNPYGDFEKADDGDYVSQTNNPNYFKFRDSYVPGTEEAFTKNVTSTASNLFEFMTLFAAPEIALTYGVAKLIYVVFNAKGTEAERKKKIGDALLGLLPGELGRAASIATQLGIDEVIIQEFEDGDEKFQEEVVVKIIENIDSPKNKKLTDKINKKIKEKHPDAAKEAAQEYDLDAVAMK